MTPSLEGWPPNAKEALPPHEVRLAPLNTNPVFQSLEVPVTLNINNIKTYEHTTSQLFV